MVNELARSENDSFTIRHSPFTVYRSGRLRRSQQHPQLFVDTSTLSA